MVTDGGIVAAGHVGRAVALLDEVVVYDEVRENPTESDVAACAEFARELKPDVIVGLGGGSAMDTAKGVLFLLSGGGTMSDYQGQLFCVGTDLMRKWRVGIRELWRRR